MKSAFKASSIALCCLFLASAGTAQTTDGQPAQSYGHLNHQEGGPPWTLEELRAAIPPGTVPMTVDRSKPITNVENPAAAMLAALKCLESNQKPDHELAFRIFGATLKHAELADARRALAYLMYHGIGTRTDAAASVRMAMPLVRTGDRLACEFAAITLPDAFKAATTPVTVDKIAKTAPTGPIRIGGTITELDEKVVQLDGSKQEFELDDTSDRMQPGRHLDLWGLLVNGKFRALLNEVPEPKADFKWKVNAQSYYDGRWRVHDVRVTVNNTGLQPISMVRFNVRCYVNTISTGDREQSASVTDIAPGKSKTITVSFESYDYYFRSINTPKANVEVESVEW